MIKMNEYSFSDIMDGFFDGPHATPTPSEYGPVFLGIKNIKEGGGIDLNEIRHISENEFSNWTKRVVPREDDLVFSYEATLHRYALIPHGFRGCLGRRMALIRVNKEVVDPRFLYYHFLSPYWRAFIETVKVAGSTVDRISIISFPKYRIDLPDLLTQKKIASILSAYDDLIENNNQRIKLLEEMAEEIYKEWFVRMRFPGYQNSKFFDADGNEVSHGIAGALPEGWEMKLVRDIIERYNAGKKYDNKTALEKGKVPILDQGQSGFIGFHNDEPDVRASMDDPIIVFANHTCYQNLIQFDFSAIQNILPFKSSKEYPRNIFWLHYATKDLIVFNDYKGHWPEFSTKKVLLPLVEISEYFGQLIKPMLNEVFILKNKNQLLQETRDLLLPRLISGKLSVEDIQIEKIITPAMAAEPEMAYKN
jgi:type I restriction enzyme S subunit